MFSDKGSNVSIAVIGGGFVGITLAARLLEVENLHITVFDDDPVKIENFKANNYLVDEPGLQEILVEAEKLGNDVMHERLAKLDPAAALAIPKENIRRVIRALEVIELTGKPFTANLPRQESSKYPDAKQFGLVLDRGNLDEKIDKRVEDMWAKGFAREVSTLMTKGLEQSGTAKKALGYMQIMNYLNGESDEAFAKEETKRVTRAYARRQETWFSRDERIKWLAPESNAARLEKLLASIN